MTTLQIVFIIYACLLVAMCVPGAMGVYSKRGIHGKAFKIFLVGLAALIVFAGFVVAESCSLQ